MDEIRSAHRHLAVLRFLAAMPGGCSNEQVLSALLDKVGLVSSSDEIRACLRHLEHIGAVELEFATTLVVPTLLARGAEIADGRISVEGVQPPGPACAY